MPTHTFTMIRPCSHCGRDFALTNSAQIHCSITCRFWSKVRIDDVDACWIWEGSRQPRGYGLFCNGGVELAHRIVWLLEFGAMPDLCVLHHCDNPPCVNPAHLFLGTHGDNNRDRSAKGRNGRARGAASGHAKLCEAQIPEIRALRASGMTLCEIGRRFGVTSGAISAITQGRAWHYVH
jgi:hypothetical protein